MPYSEPVVFICSTSIPINPCVVLNSELRRKLAFLFSRCCQSGCWAVLHAEKAVAVAGWAEQLCSALLPGAWKSSSAELYPSHSIRHRQLSIWQQIVPGVDKTGWGWPRLCTNLAALPWASLNALTAIAFFLWVKLFLNVWTCRDTMQLLPIPCLAEQHVSPHSFFFQRDINRLNARKEEMFQIPPFLRTVVIHTYTTWVHSKSIGYCLILGGWEITHDIGWSHLAVRNMFLSTHLLAKPWG